MHELALARAIRDTAARHAAGRRVSAVRVRVGAMRQVVPQSLCFHFDAVSRGSSLEGARLELEPVAARLRCEGCGQVWEPETPSFRCPRCAGAGVRLLSGEELRVESIDVEEEEEEVRA